MDSGQSLSPPTTPVLLVAAVVVCHLVRMNHNLAPPLEDKVVTSQPSDEPVQPITPLIRGMIFDK